MKNDVKLGFVIAGLCLMVFAVMLFIFINREPGTVIGEVFLFFIGFSCCVAGSDDERMRRNYPGGK